MRYGEWPLPYLGCYSSSENATFGNSLPHWLHNAGIQTYDMRLQHVRVSASLKLLSSLNGILMLTIDVSAQWWIDVISILLLCGKWLKLGAIAQGTLYVVQLSAKQSEMRDIN